MTWYINCLAWRQRIISLVCFANNAIHPWPQVMPIFDREMLPGFTPAIFLCRNFVYIEITLVGREPDWIPGPALNSGQLGFRGHMGLKMGLQDGSDWTRKFIHKMNILALEVNDMNDIFNSLAWWRQRIISLACFSNNVIHPLSLMNLGADIRPGNPDS